MAHRGASRITSDADAKILSGMKLLILVTVCLLPLAAQEKPEPKPRALESVRIDTANWKLTWTVSEGRKEDGKYVAERLIDYTIDPDAATMILDSEPGDVRRFSGREADALNKILETLAKYCAESTAWHEAGEGKGDPEKPTKPATMKAKL
jgi:hypothetical protein